MGFDIQAFEKASQSVQNWLADYFQTMPSKPVRSSATPGDIRNQLPSSAPITGESFADILADFDELASIGVTHWNHPRFFAYFPCSTSPVALAADQLAAALSQQGMLWQTSPFSTELEGRMIEWIAALLGLEDDGFSGVINDTASTSTLSAILMAREKITHFGGRNVGLHAYPPLRIYVSPEAHTSIKKAAWLAGIGSDNVVEVPTNDQDQMDAKQLEAQIAEDRQKGLLPMMIVGAAGGTSVGAFDDFNALADVAVAHDLFFHIDAAWAGVAAIADRLRQPFDGWERADSLVLNPHKWLMTGMECSVFLLKDPALLTQTMSAMPSYLETHRDEPLVNYSEWTPQLGRSFRSLKLWFVLRYYGSHGLAEMLLSHVRWAVDLCERLREVDGLSITTEPSLSLFSFAADTNERTLELLKRINDDGRIYLTQTTYRGQTVIRFVAGTVSTDAEDVVLAGDVIEEIWTHVRAEHSQKVGVISP